MKTPSFKFEKFIYDSVHGHIGITEEELKLIDSPIFQRLHHINHLGTAYLVYPGATHTRFAHSLGTMFIMGKVAERLYELEFITDNDEIQKLRLAALLHDIGHFPFSHKIEKPLGDHEEFSHHLITKSGLADEFNTYKPEEIVAILEKRYLNEIYSLLISSDLDVDRIDYLLRDAHETGVSYGFIDSDRLIRTIVIGEDEKHLAVDYKGRYALENFLIARYHMFQTVYYHKTIVGFSLLLERIYEILMREGKAYNYKQLLDLSDEKIYEFNDNYVCKLLQENRNDPGEVGELIRRFLYRKRLLMIKEIQGISISGLETDEYTKLSLIELPNQLEGVIKESGIPKEWIFYFNPKPLEILSEKDGERAIWIKRKDKTLIPIAQDKTSVVSMLYDHGYLSSRIYTKDEHETDLLRGLKQCLDV